MVNYSRGVAATRGRIIEVDSVDEFDALVAAGARRMRGWRLQGLDLRERSEQLQSLDAHGSLFLGCELSDEANDRIRDQGGLILPTFEELPFEVYRESVYSPDELYAGISAAPYSSTPDARIYAWSRQLHPTNDATLSRALHDHAIEAGLDALLRGRRTVGVMGGHTVARDSAAYAEAAALGREVTRRGMLVASGGGPGAMEAANLGAYLANAPDSAIVEAVKMLRGHPGYRPSITNWARAAFEVRARWPDGADSIGIPTWFYGHEPPNPFASHIAKYFRNALREDILLSRCDAGIVFLPGAAGTVQEIFQDACENYYADEATTAPMVLVGTEHWTDHVPAWPLLESLASGRDMAPKVHLVDSIDDAVRLLS